MRHRFSFGVTLKNTEMARLLKYEYKMFIPYGDAGYDTLYELTLMKSYLFGLIKREKKVTYRVSSAHSTCLHTKHWDRLIETGASF